MNEQDTLTFEPVTPERWADFEALFGKNGACAGCWCMWWRQSRADWTRNQGEGNKQAMRAIIESGSVPGILAYVNGKPAGWCSVAPRGEFPSLDRSKVLFPVDDHPVWSIVCFFVGRPFRRKGLAKTLIQAAVEYAKKNGAQIVESYPTERPGKFSALSDFMGLASTFREAGFVEVARRSPTRPIMRIEP